MLAAGSVALALRDGGHGRRPPRAAAVAAPASSTPDTTVPAATTTTLDPAATRLAARLDAVMAGTTGCLIVTDGATLLYDDQPTVTFAPASTQKLLVAAAALALLGPNYRFTTEVVTDKAPVAGQAGSLWLVGGGDPLLATPEYIAHAAGQPRVQGYPFTPIATLADAIAAVGIRTVAGGVHGDDSRYDKLRWLPAWPASYRAEGQIGALSALTVNEGIALLNPVPKLAPDPPTLAASELARLLVVRHVAAAAGPDATAPAGAAVVAQLASAPLSQIVDAMLRASDNLIAEMLVRELDRAEGGTGTTAGGLAVVLHEDAVLGVPVGSAHLDDGSGLAPSDRATCPLLLDALNLSDKTGLQGIGQGLAVAGRTGTLVRRFIGTPEAGKLSAKTGSIQNAAGLVGILDVTRPVRFALLLNQPGTDTQLLDKEDQIVAAIATYPD